MSRTCTILASAPFVSGLQRCEEPGVGQVRQAVIATIRAFGYSGCVARVAQEFGDHPDTAVIRMRWARSAVHGAFADATSQSTESRALPIGSHSQAARPGPRHREVHGVTANAGLAIPGAMHLYIVAPDGNDLGR